MSISIQHNRGDVYLGNKGNLKDGQIFLSYVNNDYTSSDSHSYSEGQLWVKDPSNTNLTEIANARSLNSLIFKGYITESFDGDFINANEDSQKEFKHCHEGDFWIFNSKRESGFTTTFYKDDILLITKTEYETVENQAFRETLKSVEYVRISGSSLDSENSDLPEDSHEAFKNLELRLRYKGEFSTLQSFYNLEKKQGNLYILTEPLSINKTNFVVGTKRATDTNFVNLSRGDLIWWNGSKWEIIPSGSNASTILYTPNSTEIDNVETFEDWYKTELKSSTNVQEALDVLNRNVAHLGKNGKIPFSELPDVVRKGLSLQGKFYPLTGEDNSKKDDPDYQNPWPTSSDETDIYTGCFWIVDCNSVQNVQYVDKTQDGRILELNTGDWIVWIDATNQFEVIDNSDRISSIDVIDYDTKKRTSLVGNVGITSDGSKIPLSVTGNTITIGTNEIVTQDPDEDGKKNYFPIYESDSDNIITNSELYQDDDTSTITSFINFQIGTKNNSATGLTYGNFGVKSTAGSTTTSYINNFLFIESVHLLKSSNTRFDRLTKILASEKNNLATGDEELSIYLPEASSILLGVLTDDELTLNYIPKAGKTEDFITDSLTAEIIYKDALLEENYEQGYFNIGIGRTTSEDIDTGEIVFYAKTTDRLSNQYTDTARGFYTQYHSVVNNISHGKDQVEHVLNRSEVRTHLVINPSVLASEEETFVKMPLVSGTLITWGEIQSLYGEGGIPLMIPVWEKKTLRNEEYIGLDTSPITIKINRDAHDSTKVTRTNDLSKRYGDGIKSTWSYINSDKEGSLQDLKRTSVDDVVDFDSWLEVQRAIATNEALILPATARKDGNSTLDVNLKFTEDSEETSLEYSTSKVNGNYQRIVPSRSIYPEESVYYDPITGKLIPQNHTTKDVEMPAVGGVLLTSRSRIDGGVWQV